MYMYMYNSELEVATAKVGNVAKLFFFSGDKLFTLFADYKLF